ncbi:MAG: YraN family protein [Bacteroidota bacterium]
MQTYKPSISKGPQWGQEAEALAADYLYEKGFRIIARNYRYRKAEIDIIACKENCLFFVEVKARSNLHYGYPESFVNGAKQVLIRAAAEHYIMRYNWQQAVRFDIISVRRAQGKLHIEHFEDAFY